MNTNTMELNLNEMEMVNGCGTGFFTDRDSLASSIMDGAIIGGSVCSVVGAVVAGPVGGIYGGLAGIAVGSVVGGIIGGVTYEEPEKKC